MEYLNIISTTEFANLAPEIDTSMYTDATVSGIISQSSRLVSDYIGYSPFAENITDELREGRISVEGDLVIYPQKIPVISVSSIKIAKGSSSGDYNITLTESGNEKFNVDFAGRTIRYPGSALSLTGSPIFQDLFGLRGKHFYTKVTYRAGYEPSNLPEVIKLATVLYTRDNLARSMNTSGAKKISQGGISLEYSERKDAKSDLVADAERMLRPYRRVG